MKIIRSSYFSRLGHWLVAGLRLYEEHTVPERYEQEHQLKLGVRPQEEETEVDEKEDISLQGQQACWTAAICWILLINTVFACRLYESEAPMRAEFLQKSLISAFFGFQWQNLAEILHLFEKYNNPRKVAVRE